MLSLLYNTELLLGNTRFSLKAEALTKTNLFRSGTIIMGWSSKLHSHLLIELSPLSTLLLSVADNNISSGCFSTQKATMGDYFKLQLQKRCCLGFCLFFSLFSISEPDVPLLEISTEVEGDLVTGTC